MRDNILLFDFMSYSLFNLIVHIIRYDNPFHFSHVIYSSVIRHHVSEMNRRKHILCIISKFKMKKKNEANTRFFQKVTQLKKCNFSVDDSFGSQKHFSILNLIILVRLMNEDYTFL